MVRTLEVEAYYFFIVSNLAIMFCIAIPCITLIDDLVLINMPQNFLTSTIFQFCVAIQHTIYSLYNISNWNPKSIIKLYNYIIYQVYCMQNKIKNLKKL